MSSQGRVRSVLDALAAVSVIVASIAIVYSVWTGRRPSVVSPAVNRGATGAQDVESQGLRLQLMDAEFHPGTKTRLAIVEFSDFECPYCGRHGRSTFPRIKHELVDTGYTIYALRHLPLEGLHPNAVAAAQAAVCAQQQGRQWEMYAWLFDHQATLGRDQIQGATGQVGLDAARFAGCMKSSRGDVEKDLAEAQRVGVASTPTFLIGAVDAKGLVSIRRRLTGAVPFESFNSVVRELLTATARSARG